MGVYVDVPTVAGGGVDAAVVNVAAFVIVTSRCIALGSVAFGNGEHSGVVNSNVDHVDDVEVHVGGVGTTAGIARTQSSGRI